MFLLARRTCSISHSGFGFVPIPRALSKQFILFRTGERYHSVLFICVLVLFLQIWWLKLPGKLSSFSMLLTIKGYCW